MATQKPKGSILVVLLALVAFLVLNSIVKPRTPIIETKLGKVQGVIQRSRSGREYYAFLGISYAKPPVGELRFEPPIPLSSWGDEVLDASSFGSRCAQVELVMKVTLGSEDCLTLNIYVPQRDSKELNQEPMSVMFFIHGGGYITGTTILYGAEYFMDEDIILVTVNYRLGALGFLNSGDGQILGNMGLKDQAMGLRFVKDNIAYFGGNPDSITIAGQSAGASSVSHHCLSSYSQGLFHRAIIQSGSPLSIWGIHPNSNVEDQVQVLASHVGCVRNTSKAMIKCLKHLSVSKLLETHLDFKFIPDNTKKVFMPTVEKFGDAEFTLLGDSPSNLMQNKKFKKIPILTGITSDEGLLAGVGVFQNETMLNRLNDNYHLVSTFLNQYSSSMTTTTDQIRQHYFGNVSKITKDMRLQFVRMITDRHFVQPLKRFVELHVNNSMMWVYYYNYSGPYSLGRLLEAAEYHDSYVPKPIRVGVQVIKEYIFALLGWKLNFIGNCHADEIPLLFRFPYVPVIREGNIDYPISRDMVKAWAHFVQGRTELNFRNISWLPVDKSLKTFNFLKIQEPPTMAYTHFDDVFSKINSLDLL